jgi:dTDP-4-amino-4,6-dideoxygalactose transaminase
MTPRTRAIIPVHLYGLCADMDPLAEAARRHDVAIVEDAAQAIGATYNGRPAGSLGDFGCFSFFPSKNLGGFGDSGLVTVDTDERRDLVRILRVHGSSPKYYHRLIGGNFRIDPLQAAVLRVKAPHLQAWTEARRSNARTYRELFDEYRLAEVITLPEVPEGYGHVFNQFVVRMPRRDEVRSFLASRGVGTEIYYPVPFHLQECFAHLGYRRGAFPVSETAAAEVLALPVYSGLTVDQQRHVVESIATFCRTV